MRTGRGKSCRWQRVSARFHDSPVCYEAPDWSVVRRLDQENNTNHSIFATHSVHVLHIEREMARRRPQRGVGFSSVIVACFVAARSVHGFVAVQAPSQVPPRCARAPAHRQSMSADSPAVSRAQLLRELIPAVVLGAVVAGPARPATAALPTAEDYSFGTGSKVRKAA